MDRFQHYHFRTTLRRIPQCTTVLLHSTKFGYICEHENTYLVPGSLIVQTFGMHIYSTLSMGVKKAKKTGFSFEYVRQNERTKIVGVEGL